MNEYGVVIAARTVRFERVLPGPIERVWSYLTESEKRRKWLASGEMELRVGGRVELIFNHANLSAKLGPTPERYKHEIGETFIGRVTRCEPPRLLSFIWDAAAPHSSEVTFELTPRGADVLLVLTERLLRDHAEMVSVASGWHTHLGILIDRLNGREPRLDWSTRDQVEAEYEKRMPPD
jgi:uncharacterized protein YndB with AHSA1/START domain